MSRKASLSFVAGQPSWKIASQTVEAALTAVGGHLGPVIFDRTGRRIGPYAVAPWAEERGLEQYPPILQVLRGDFFCMPFGGNARRWRGEKHPVHGETANNRWEFIGLSRNAGRLTLHVRMDTTVRRGRVDKLITLIDGHDAVYCRHVVSGMSGPMSFGHHAMLRFPEPEGSGLISTSRFVHGQVYPEAFEDAAIGGYSSLRPGATFRSLSRVPMASGGYADLSRYPARAGYEDLVQIIADPRLRLGWTAVSFPGEGYAWFALKDPKVLTGTVLWHSNGGRHYPPWNGRHRRVLGLEEVTSYFHTGLAESAGNNPHRRAGYTTCLKMDPRRPLVVNYIMAVTPIPRAFGAIRDIRMGNDVAVLTDTAGKTVRCPLDVDFLYAGPEG